MLGILNEAVEISVILNLLEEINISVKIESCIFPVGKKTD